MRSVGGNRWKLFSNTLGFFLCLAPHLMVLFGGLEENPTEQLTLNESQATKE